MRDFMIEIVEYLKAKKERKEQEKALKQESI